MDTRQNAPVDGVELLKHIAGHSINNGSVADYPSVLIIGHGKDFMAQALSNSVFLEDVRICKGQYFDQGYSSYQFFDHSLPTTAHIIEDIQDIKPVSQAMIWKYLKLGCCCYYRGIDSNILHCNGMIILTADTISRVPKTIVNSVDHIAYLAPPHKGLFEQGHQAISEILRDRVFKQENHCRNPQEQFHNQTGHSDTQKPVWSY